MDDHDPTPTHPRRPTIGAFLLHHPTTPRTERLDRPSPHDPDVRQDAALHLLLYLRRRNLPPDPDQDPLASFDAHPRLAAIALRQAHRDAYRALRRHPTLAEAALRPLPPAADAALSLLALVPDLAAADALKSAESDAPDRLAALWDHGLPGHPLGPLRAALICLRLAQLRARQGLPLHPKLRKRLTRLRRELALPLLTDLL